MRILFAALLLLSSAGVLISAQTRQPITIRAGKLIDGRGGIQENVVVTIQDGKIASIGRNAGAVVCVVRYT